MYGLIVAFASGLHFLQIGLTNLFAEHGQVLSVHIAYPRDEQAATTYG